MQSCSETGEPAAGPYDGWLPVLERQGKKLFGAHFRLYTEDQALQARLLAYFLQDRERARQYGVSLRKGLLLSGPVGCGKTSLMTLLRLLLSPGERYRTRSCRQVSFEFQREGFEVIRRYGEGYLPGGSPRPLTYFFDDLGTESRQKHYGNDCNVMGEILLSRYDLFVSTGLKTHLTTNLTSAEIEQFYGTRVRSRMREMFNLISFGKEARDKRV
ncbi:ATPase [Pontibacter silvestris]|uniref:ATPase n=1 Tax=Pontibacter silvestris TaxID=2305183 RepID=A0ABW4X149_9BACT|nr:ATPase [Pontibacter silvestris]MCC9137538.1 ATPase [Pontibacter silvestris]